MKNKGMLALLLATALISPTAAGAAGAPTSQFGFSGWPYKQATDCGNVGNSAEDDCTLPPSSTAPIVTPAPTVMPTQAPQATQKPQNSLTAYTPSAQENQMFALVNSDRAANGLAALNLDPQLCYLAQLKSTDMRDNGYFAHESPTYGNAAAMLTTFGYQFSGVGENIAHHATVEKAQAAFLSSEGHRRNIMGSQWTKVGIGVCYDANGFVYVTQIFAR